MNNSVSHDRNDENPEAKAQWFQSLSLSDRMMLLCAYTDLIFGINPHISDLKDAQQTSKRFLIL